MCEKIDIGDFMQKTIRNIVLIAVALFVCNLGEAKAVETGAYCVYQDGSGTKQIAVSVTTDEINFTIVPGGSSFDKIDTVNISRHYNFYLSHYNFITGDNKIGCLKKLYYSNEVSSGYNYFNVYSSSDEVNADNVFEFTLVESDSQIYTGVDSTIKQYTNKCRYAGLYLYYGNGEVKFEEPKSISPLAPIPNEVIFEGKYDDLPETCPEQIYIMPFRNSTAKTQTYIYLENPEYDTIITTSLSSVDIPDSSSIITSIDTSNSGSSGTPEDNTTCAIFGEKTTDLLQWIIDLIQIAVPVIIIIMTIVDFVGVAVSGEEKNFKAAGSKLVKRLIVGITIIFLPMLLAFIIDFSGALVPYGIERNQLFCSLF